MFNVKGRMAHLDEKDYKAGKRSDSQVASVSNKTQPSTLIFIDKVPKILTPSNQQRRNLQ